MYLTKWASPPLDLPIPQPVKGLGAGNSENVPFE